MAKARQDAESKKIMAQDDKAPKRIQNILDVNSHPTVPKEEERRYE